MDKSTFTREQQDWICEVIGDWYLRWKHCIADYNDQTHRLGFAKEQLKEMLCGTDYLNIKDEIKYPHKCPLCEGVGFKNPEIMTVDRSMVIDGIKCEPGDPIWHKPVCNSCDGKGIVWG